MYDDAISEMGIDSKDRLYIIPLSQKFPYIYREAMEVHWDSKGGFLYSPKPREWSYFDWYRQIISAVKEQGCTLYITEKTKWVNIPNGLKAEIEALDANI